MFRSFGTTKARQYRKLGANISKYGLPNFEEKERRLCFGTTFGGEWVLLHKTVPAPEIVRDNKKKEDHQQRCGFRNDCLRKFYFKSCFGMLRVLLNK